MQKTFLININEYEIKNTACRLRVAGAPANTDELSRKWIISNTPVCACGMKLRIWKFLNCCCTPPSIFLSNRGILRCSNQTVLACKAQNGGRCHIANGFVFQIIIPRRSLELFQFVTSPLPSRSTFNDHTRAMLLNCHLTISMVCRSFARPYSPID